MTFIDQQIQLLIQQALTAPPEKAVGLYNDALRLQALKEAKEDQA